GERFLAPLASHFHVVCLSVRGGGRVRRGQADDQEALLRKLRAFRKSLSKRELGLEASGWKVCGIVELAGIGDPLVDENQARPVLVKQLSEHVAGASSLLFVGLEPLEGLLTAE